MRQSTEIFHLRDVKEVSSQLMEFSVRHRFRSLSIPKGGYLETFPRV